MTEESTMTPTLADRIDMAVWNALKKDDVLKHDRYISVRRDVHWAIVDVLEATEAERAKRDRAMADRLEKRNAVIAEAIQTVVEMEKRFQLPLSINAFTVMVDSWSYLKGTFRQIGIEDADLAAALKEQERGNPKPQ